MRWARVTQGAALGVALVVGGLRPAGAAETNFVEQFDTIYNSLTVERRGDLVELRARARGSEALESTLV